MSTLESEPGLGIHRSGWTPADSAALYRIGDWAEGYFSVNEKGHIVARPRGSSDAEIDLFEVVSGLKERDIAAPVLVRFTDILSHRLQAMRDAFEHAMKENSYKGGYRGVYPIKVNQQHQVVEEVCRFGEQLGFGLEVGSKPELLAVMAMPMSAQTQLIICNGFKDAKYIEAVVLATKLGRQIIPVVENFEELRLIIRYAKHYNVRPTIGVRVKLASKGAGRWESSSGVKSKFGLFVSELIDMVRLLREHQMLDCLQLLHCHAGSQMQDIRRIKDTINELAHIYVELVRMGVGLKYLDVGGGLGVDYQGLQANVSSSMNYSMTEYASDVVYRIASVCDAAEVAHPTIVTECGRAMVAYSSVLIFNVVGATGPAMLQTPSMLEIKVGQAEETPQPILDLKDAFEGIHAERVLECYHDAVQARDAAITLFGLGYLTLELRALAERMFWAICWRIRDVSRSLEEIPDELAELEVILSDVYFCNFSLFQSLPDTWAIDHLFPIMPIHRLGERPTRCAILADITCDSDGKVDRFVSLDDPSPTLDVHALRSNEEYYLGVFLVGAYQETLGDLHNLFGDTHAVHIRLDDGEWVIEEVVQGDTSQEVLAYVQYEPKQLFRQMQQDCEKAMRAGRMSVKETQVLLRFYESGMNSYTYLEPQDD